MYHLDYPQRHESNNSVLSGTAPARPAGALRPPAILLWSLLCAMSDCAFSPNMTGQSKRTQSALPT